MSNNEDLRWAIARQISDWVGFECEAVECLPNADAILESSWLAADRKAQRAEAWTEGVVAGALSVGRRTEPLPNPYEGDQS